MFQHNLHDHDDDEHPADDSLHPDDKDKWLRTWSCYDELKQQVFNFSHTA